MAELSYFNNKLCWTEPRPMLWTYLSFVLAYPQLWYWTFCGHLLKRWQDTCSQSLIIQAGRFFAIGRTLDVLKHMNGFHSENVYTWGHSFSRGNGWRIACTSYVNAHQKHVYHLECELCQIEILDNKVVELHPLDLLFLLNYIAELPFLQLTHEI